jgi:hypothetical protein
VDGKTEDALACVDWSKYSPALSGKKLFLKTKRGSPFPWVLAQRPDGSCVFLEESECLVHRVLGYDSKDLTCRQFPVKFMKTPDGVYVGFSFACKSMRENSGKPVGECLEEYGRLYGEFSARDKGKRFKVMLNKSTTLEWGAYKALESCLSDILRTEGKSIKESLYACSLFLASLEKAFSGKVSLSESDVLGFAKAGGTTRFYLPIPSSPYFPSRQRVVLAFSVVNYTENTSLLGKIVNPFLYYLKFVSGKGEVNLKQVGEVKLEELGALEFDAEEEKTREFLARYFTHFFFRKSLLAPPRVSDNLKLLVIGYALIRFYSLCHALKRESSRTDCEDVSFAVGCVDRFFLLHSTQSKTLLTDRKTEFLLRTFLDDPDFEACMLDDKPFTPPA